MDRRRYRPKRLFSNRSKAASASDATTNTQNSQLRSKANSAMSAAATRTIAAIWRCLLVQRNAGPAYRPRGGSKAVRRVCEDRAVTRREKNGDFR